MENLIGFAIGYFVGWYANRFITKYKGDKLRRVKRWGSYD